MTQSVLAGTGYINTTPMTDSSNYYHSRNHAALRQRLQIDGYLLLRSVIPESDVIEARNTILSDMHSNGFISQSPNKDAQMFESPWPRDRPGPSLLSRYDLMQEESVLNVLESEIIRELMDELIGPSAEDNQESGIECLPYKWLRAVGTSLYTGPHLDRVYLPKNPHLLTCWIPIGACPTNLGSLVVAHSSHTSPSFARLRAEYGLSLLGKDGTNSGWIDEDPNRIEEMYETGAIDWRSCEFGVGDVCIFGIDLLHVSATNIASRWRLSCDTRWYRQGHPTPPY